MEFFNKMFNDKNNAAESEMNKLPWNELVRMETLDELDEISKTLPVVIFKHSTRCIISRKVLKQFEQDYESGIHVNLYFLDLLSHRDISNKIATRFQVQHESPQLIVIKNEKVIYYASHHEIYWEKLKDIIG